MQKLQKIPKTNQFQLKDIIKLSKTNKFQFKTTKNNDFQFEVVVNQTEAMELWHKNHQNPQKNSPIEHCSASHSHNNIKNRPINTTFIRILSNSNKKVFKQAKARENLPKNESTRKRRTETTRFFDPLFFFACVLFVQSKPL